MRNRIIVLFIICVISFDNTYSQTKELNIVGVWQFGSYQVAGLLFDNYRFYDDGKFEFRPGDNNGLNRTKSLNGNYKVEGDSLVLTIVSVTEYIGGLPTRGPTAPGSGWEIIGGKVKTSTFKKYRVKLLMTMEERESRPCLMLDLVPYYKVTL